MLYSRGCEYAIRALVFLATQSPGHRYSTYEIAQAEAIPAHFLAKMLQKLVEAEILTSQKGPGGGFSLARSADNITLFEVVSAIDGISDFKRCAIGPVKCTDENPCPIHPQWKEVREQITHYLNEVKISMLAQATAAKKQMLAESLVNPQFIEPGRIV